MNSAKFLKFVFGKVNAYVNKEFKRKNYIYIVYLYVENRQFINRDDKQGRCIVPYGMVRPDLLSWLGVWRCLGVEACWGRTFFMRQNKPNVPLQ